ALPSPDFKHLVELFWDMFGPEADPAKAPSGILNFLSIDFFFKDVKNKERVGFLVEEEESFEATIKSWRENYAGKAQHELLAYMRDYMDKRNEGKNYARYTTVIQSSGMGKSRMIDELAKIVFVIPLCLRSSDKGFPPPDDNVRDYITDKYDEAIVNIRSVAFLGALMDHTYTWVQENCKGNFSYMKAAEDFRDVNTAEGVNARELSRSPSMCFIWENIAVLQLPRSLKVQGGI
ncbi:hypothetical protein EW145_g5506, partial [Phellinidium pouzarii]